MALKLQARILKLQTLDPNGYSTYDDAMLDSTFSVMCSDTTGVGQGVFEME
jgi:hypothetical protein